MAKNNVSPTGQVKVLLSELNSLSQKRLYNSDQPKRENNAFLEKFEIIVKTIKIFYGCSRNIIKYNIT